jgi:hypothetical protein
MPYTDLTEREREAELAAAAQNLPPHVLAAAAPPPDTHVEAHLVDSHDELPHSHAPLTAPGHDPLPGAESEAEEGVPPPTPTPPPLQVKTLPPATPRPAPITNADGAGAAGRKLLSVEDNAASSDGQFPAHCNEALCVGE